MEKYAVVKEKLKKLNAEQGKGDSYDPFSSAQRTPHNNRPYALRQPYSEQKDSEDSSRAQNPLPYSQAFQDGEQLDINIDAATHYASQPAASPVEKAIGTLQHRSHSEGHRPDISRPEAFEGVIQDRASTAASNDCEDDPIAQEIHRLELRAIDINNRSQQQADDILDLKRAAQQAAIAFGRQGIHDHPQLEIINRFFERYAASHVPIIERDGHGHFTLSDYTINLRRAEEEAIENAAVLRSSRRVESPTQLSVQPFTQPIISGQTSTKKILSAGRAHTKKNNRRVNLVAQLNRAISVMGALLSKSWKLHLRTVRAKTASSRAISTDMHNTLATEQYIEGYQRNHEFSLFDGVIWFSSAAIAARLALKTLVSLFPIFQPVLWLAPLSLFCAAIYLLFVAKSNNTTLMYRLVLVALGLFISGSV